MQWAFAPTWIVGSRAGLSTLLQALPAAIFGLFALVIGSLFVLGQQAVNLYGSRAVVVLLEDAQTINLPLRAIALGVAALLLGGQVPDVGKPAHSVTAGAATIAVATAALLLSALGALFALLGQYTAPRNFMLRTTESVPSHLQSGALDTVVYKIPMLGEMARAGLRRGESVAVSAALEGLTTIQLAYIEASKSDPLLTQQPSEDGKAERDGWLGTDLSATLVRAGEEGLRVGAAEHDLETIAWTTEDAAANAIRAGQTTEAAELIDGVIRLGVTSHQIRPETINLWPQAAPSLARLEHVAVDAGQPDLPGQAFAGWALTVAYVLVHFGARHPGLDLSIRELSERPPIRAAENLIRSTDWQTKWANKLEAGIDPCLEALKYATGQPNIFLAGPAATS